jgi:ASC-1-like (ASCH) protein
MATFEATTTSVTFAHMEGTTKTVFIVPRTIKFDMVTSGDRIEFESLGSITIGAVRRYQTLKDMFEAQGFDNVVPDADTTEEATERIRATPDWDRKVEDKAGVMALRVRSTKRKS